jgi:hypothetical protein
MFLNVRLMVVAILAAVAGIGCGLGLFATFRVNHEPLARLAEGSPPLQLAFDNLALSSDARMPLEARLPISAAVKPISVPVVTPSPVTPSAVTPSALTPNPVIPSVAAVEQVGADSAIAGEASVRQATADAGAVQSNAATLAVAVPVQQSSVTPEATAPTAPTQQETVAAAEDQQPSASAAPSPIAEQTAAIDAAAEDQQPAVKPATSAESKAAKPAVRTSRPAARARRASKALRARRTITAVATQPVYQYSQPAYSQPTYAQPTYTWTDGTAQASQSVKRVQIRRHRAAKKAALTARSAPLAATAGLSGMP